MSRNRHRQRWQRSWRRELLGLSRRAVVGRYGAMVVVAGSMLLLFAVPSSGESA